MHFSRADSLRKETGSHAIIRDRRYCRSLVDNQ
jgi:hypothetical protein